MRYLVWALALALCFAETALAEPPAFYGNVSRVIWVARDVDSVIEKWEKIGLQDVRRDGESAVAAEFRGEAVTGRVRRASGRLGGVAVDFVQPLTGGNAWAEFLEEHGDGILALVYQAPDAESHGREVRRLNGLGVAVLQRGTWLVEGGELNYVLLDTEAGGKYVLGLAHGAPAPPAAAPPAVRLSQYAFVIREFAPVSAYWERLGFPAFQITKSSVRDTRYRGKPVTYGQELGWQRHTPVAFEWCVPPPDLPGIYGEFLEKHGEGLQHLGFNVPDMDEAIARYERLGLNVVLAGAWGEEGKPGSGRFAYIDTDAMGGVVVELLWNYRAAPGN